MNIVWKPGDLVRIVHPRHYMSDISGINLWTVPAIGKPTLLGPCVKSQKPFNVPENTIIMLIEEIGNNAGCWRILYQEKIYELWEPFFRERVSK